MPTPFKYLPIMSELQAPSTIVTALQLSIVVPALNEADNVEPLVREVKTVVIDQGITAELIIVDDGSTDQTLAILTRLQPSYPWLRVLHRDKPQGQSAAMFAGIAAARGQFIGTLDADLQNDPADLPKMLAIIARDHVDMVQGDRSAARADTFKRKFTSWVGRTYRKIVLGDTIRDTGCTARVVRASYYKQVPLQYHGMHRFIPAYCKRLGAKVVEMPVHHRPRVAGVTKYGAFKRGLTGFFDGLAVRWMFRRVRDTSTHEMTPGREVSSNP